jgi:hypothetical protein
MTEHSGGGQSVFMRDRVDNRVQAFAGEPRWHQRPTARGHLALVVLAVLAAVNLLAVVPIG